jgi:glutathione reductase (NADPH)
VPELDDLDLDRAGVKREKRGVIVNEYLQSVSNSAVYAGGDAAASGPALTPKADHDAGVLVTNLLEGNRRTVNYEGIASAVFTIPPLASAGPTENAARAAGLKFRTSWQNTSGCSTRAGWARPRPASRCSSRKAAAGSWERIFSGPTPPRSSISSPSPSDWGFPPMTSSRLFAYPTNGSDIRFML